MALEEYRRKRDFRKTPEPAGKLPAHKKAAAPLVFVIQEHKARRLHFDFRLELDGVLKSWAVPKGPSLDPAEKRLAVEVEDHPLDYGGFEGVIPEGQYGGGTVLLWDRGTWIPADPDPAMAFAKGMLKFELRGEKLHGNWALVRMGGKAAGERRPNWLLVKERDEAAVPQSGDAVVMDNPLSVETGRSLEAIAEDRDRVWESGKGEATPRHPPDRIRGARKGRMPANPKPQLAMPAVAAPAGPEWLHEIKYDGYRLFADIDHGKTRLVTRNGLDWTSKFPELAYAFGRLPVGTALIDGELVHLASDGTTNFSGLQDAIASGKTGILNFFAFDLLHRDGWDLTGATLEDRKAALADIIPPDTEGMLRYSDHQAGQGPAVLRQESSLGLEGTLPGSYSENSVMSSVQRAAIAWNILTAAGIPGVRDVFVPPITNGVNIVVQIKKAYQGQPKQIAAALWGSSAAQYRYKNVTVVEEDIDPASYEQVDWAFAHRVNAGEDGLVVFPGIFGSPIDPSTPPADRDVARLGTGLWNRVLIDATRSWKLERRAEWGGERFPPTVRPAAEDEARVRARWDELGLGDL